MPCSAKSAGLGSRLAARVAALQTSSAPSSARSAVNGSADPRPSTAVPGPRFGPPESYTPKHLAEKILTSKAALEGERKQVTVLFADLKGSMELLADRDPEEARKLLDPVLERMMEAVHRYEGTVNQVMGDGIMALFGAPIAHEDHAVRACYAALRMQRRVNRLRGRDSARGRDAGADPRGAQLGRGGRARHRQRPPHGLHRRRADDPSGRPDGADGEARVGAGHRRHPEAGRGLRPGPAARRGPGEGARDPDAGLRADRDRAGALPAPGQRRARPDSLRRARRASWSSSRRRSSAPRRATARRSPSWARPAWGSRGSSGSSRGRTAPTAGWCSRAARSPTGRRRRTCPSSSC